MRKTRGFTLIELVLTVSIATILCTGSIVVGLPLLNRTLTRDDMKTLKLALYRARTLSLNNVGSLSDGSPHGVHVNASAITLFEGRSYATRIPAADVLFAISGIAPITGASDVVFMQLTGTTSGATFTSSEGGVVKTITILSSGAIRYE